MQKNHRIPDRWFWLIFLIPVVSLFLLMFQPWMITQFGRTITLATNSLDPKDLYYGDYIDLRFDIEEVPVDLLDHNLKNQIDHHDFKKEKLPVYVTLKPKGKFYTVHQIVQQEPNGQEIYLKGNLHSVSKDHYVSIHYPFTRFYIEEHIGYQLNRLSRQGKLAVHVKVRNGNAVIDSWEPVSP